MTAKALLVLLLCGTALGVATHKKHKAEPKPAEETAVGPDGVSKPISTFCTELSDGTVMFSGPDMNDMPGLGKTCHDAAIDYRTSADKLNASNYRI